MHQSCDCEDDDTEFEVLEIFNTRWGMTIYSDMDKDTLREARRLLDQMIHNTPSNTIH